jgi:hypothetical protein
VIDVQRARAVMFVEPHRVEVTEVALPALGDGDVLVRTRCSGLSAGTELLAYRGDIDPDTPLDESIGAEGGDQLRRPQTAGGRRLNHLKTGPAGRMSRRVMLASSTNMRHATSSDAASAQATAALIGLT